ncbi:STAS domain-containing protein [Zhongshania sp. BJYM1]|jgi:ABC-type transporter Mla MlaB component|uniref:STAS domain-containing protein n=1 Tax=Zhongshania aquatica TaxID=2965069 RepID=UPI0022B59454|nr:STAS domain-containing protein [Marortus sp. BJYM1]
MADSSEFVILLDEPTSANVSPKADEFVYLLDGSQDDSGGSDAQADSISLKLSEASTIDTVMALYQDLAELDASAGSRIILDASAVSDSDTAVLQLLSSFVQHSERNGRDVDWYQPSLYFCDLAKHLDYTKYLKLDSLVESL